MQAHGKRMFSWPINSPNLNPIENPYKTLPNMRYHHKTKKNLSTIETAWEEESPKMIEVFLTSMPHHMKVVIKVNSGSTRW